jgi:hypothetical protein
MPVLTDRGKLTRPVLLGVNPGYGPLSQGID